MGQRRIMSNKKEFGVSDDNLGVFLEKRAIAIVSEFRHLLGKVSDKIRNGK